MEVKTTKTEFRELLSVLEKAAAFINEKSTRSKDFDLARRLIRSKALLAKRNGSLQGEAAIVINGIVYVAEPMDDCEDCAFCTGLAQCSVDFICISMREAFRKGFRDKPIGFKKWKGYERIRNIQEGNQGIS